MELINLNYDELKNYFDLYIESSLLKKIIDDNISSYNFNYEPAIYFRQENNFININIYENYNLIFMLNNIINKKIFGYCYRTKQKYECSGVSYNNNNDHLYDIIGYHFNDNDFIIYYVWEYYSPYAIFYPKYNIFYNISYRYNIIDINTLIIIYNNNFVYKTQNKIKYTIGLIKISGHYLWNEIMGLMFLIKHNLLNNIDDFVIYKYDFLNMGYLLKNKYNKNIYYDNLEKINYYNINITKIYITHDLTKMFNIFFNINNNIHTNINNKIILKYRLEINILFDIRTNSRVCINQQELIISFLNILNIKYQHIKFNIYISGIFKYNNKNLFGDEIEKQNNLINNIIINFIDKSNINIINLIGEDICNLIKLCDIFDICIQNIGSGLGWFYYILYNKPIIFLCNNYYIDSLIAQHTCFEKKLENTYYLDKDLIFNEDNKFNIFSKFTIKIEDTINFIIKILNIS